MITPLSKERLEKLATHLESGELEHKRFDFGNYSVTRQCVTAGCALGECPAIWPEHWEKRPTSIPGRFDPVISGEQEPDDSAEAFFQLSSEECDHLFYPSEQQPEEFGGIFLGCDATRHEVASNIREFIKRKEAE